MHVNYIDRELRVGMIIMNKFGFETNVLKVFDAKINSDKWKV